MYIAFQPGPDETKMFIHFGPDAMLVQLAVLLLRENTGQQCHNQRDGGGNMAALKPRAKA